MEWLKGLIRVETAWHIGNIFKSTTKANDFIIVTINIIHLAFKFIVWEERNKKMKTKEKALNINLKKLALEKKGNPRHKGSNRTPNISHLIHK